MIFIMMMQFIVICSINFRIESCMNKMTFSRINLNDKFMSILLHDIDLLHQLTIMYLPIIMKYNHPHSSGLTVFRDQWFSSDVTSHAVKRIEDVRSLRGRQFAGSFILQLLSAYLQIKSL